MLVLVVDDNRISRRIVESNLQKNNYVVVTASDGKEALDLLNENPDIQLVIADVMMPVMSGLDLLTAIKKAPELKEIPVIMCTAVSDMEHVRKACQLGCSDYIVKPVKSDVLLQKVRNIMSRHEKQVLSRNYVIMDSFGLDRREYNEILSEFRTLVDEQILALECPDVSDKDKIMGVKLTALSEGAGILGAERLQTVCDNLQNILDNVNELPLSPEEEGRVLLRELRLLKRCMAPGAPQPAS
jgi:CheY-like chemotaxis protein